MIVKDSDVENYLQWLAENDPEMASAYARVEKMHEIKKTIIATIAKQSNKSTAKDRENDALSDSRYAEFLDQFEEAIAYDRHLQLKAKVAYTAIEVWRTLQANLRKGNV